MRKSISLAAVAVLCLAGSTTEVTAGTPIKGLTIKGGHNPPIKQDSGATQENDGSASAKCVNKGTRASVAADASANRTAATTEAPVDPKNPQCITKQKTKSNQSNE